MFTTDIVDLIYPYLDLLKMEMTVQLEQGIIERNNDITGTGFFQDGPHFERFFLLGNVDKTFYPIPAVPSQLSSLNFPDEEKQSCQENGENPQS